MGRGARDVLAALAGPVRARSRVGWLRAIALAGAPRLDWTVLADHELPAVRGALDVAHALALGGLELPALQAAREALGPCAALDVPSRLALGEGDYDPALFVAMALTAAAAPSRPVFERLLGLHEQRGWGPLGGAVRSWYRTRNSGSAGFTRESVLTWSAYRRALRSAYARIAGARRRVDRKAA